MNQTHRINLSTPALDDSDYVIIEQEDWAKDVGRTSEAQGVTAIGSMIFGGAMPLPNCGGLGGFDVPVYVYPSRPGLVFKFKVSHGQARAGIAATPIREEVIQCSLNDTAQADYPVVGMTSMRWIGECYDENGNVTSRPVVTRTGRTLFFSKKVYGSIRIQYIVRRLTFNVRIEAREGSIENNFECVAYARWTGGVSYREITAPSGYDDTQGNCGNGLYGGGVSTPDECLPTGDQGNYPKAIKADRETIVQYCSQIVSSDTVTESRDTGSDEDSECEGDGTITTN